MTITQFAKFLYNDTNQMPDEFQKSIAYISATMEEL